jgi:hypothetical protein
MLRLVWRGVRFARGRAVALAAGMLVAAVAFSLLTASVEVNAADVTGVVGTNWRGDYDLLVLPHGSAQTVPGKHLVQVNYLSTATSGITMSQYATIQRLPGVQVAAPLEIVGYVLETAYIPVVLSPAAAGRSGSRVLLITSRYTADQGLSVYPPHDDGYVYITPDRVTPLLPSPKSVIHVGAVSGPTEHLPDGKNVIVCPSTIPPPPGQPSPFLRTVGLLNGSCFSRTGGTPGPVEGYAPWSFPVLMAGIDPRAEDELTGLRHAVTSGRYLAEGEGAAPVKDNVNLPTVPVIGSTRGTVRGIAVGDHACPRVGARVPGHARHGHRHGRMAGPAGAARQYVRLPLRPRLRPGPGPVLAGGPGHLPARAGRAARSGTGEQPGLGVDGRRRH